jgi:hypothetical protein
VAQLAVQWLLSAKLVLYLAAVAGSFIASLEMLVRFVELVGSLGLPISKTGLLLLLLFFGSHFGGVCAGGYGSGFVGTVWCHWSGERASRNVQVLGGSAVAVAEDGAAGRLAERGDGTWGVCC